MLDYYYFKDLQSTAVLKLNAELKVSFLAYLQIFSKITTLTSLRLLEAYPLIADMLVAPKKDLVTIIQETARFGERYALSKYDAICAAVEDTFVFDHALPNNALRIKLYIETYQECQKHLDEILEELHKAMDKLQGKTIYDWICLIQSLRGIRFLSVVVLIVEMGSFDLFTLPQNFMLNRSESCGKTVRQIQRGQSPYVQA